MSDTLAPSTISRSRPYYGWVIVGVLSLTETVSWGIIYYAFTEDVRWYIAGLAVLLVTFAAFPIRRDD